MVSQLQGVLRKCRGGVGLGGNGGDVRATRWVWRLCRGEVSLGGNGGGVIATGGVENV